jgi:L-alanine-DL-glutamate epimerase-like enolase superfamily enzyme
MQIDLEEKKLDLRYLWNISRNSSASKTNFFVRVHGHGSEGIGEVAPNIRYGETPDLVREQFSRFVKAISLPIRDIETLRVYMDMSTLCNALRFGIESAFVHWWCAHHQTDIAQFLKVSVPKVVPTSYSLPIMELGQIENFIEENNLFRFNALKVKVNAESAAETLAEVHRITKQPLILDANEAWTDVDDLVLLLEKVRRLPILFVEQPMPSVLAQEYLFLKQHTPFEIMADESVTDHADFAYLQQAFHGINVKLMKAGGYFNALNLLQKARLHGLKTMIGCMIETSVGIRSAMYLAQGVDYLDLDGFMILRQDPYGLVRESNGNLYFV